MIVPSLFLQPCAIYNFAIGVKLSSCNSREILYLAFFQFTPQPAWLHYQSPTFPRRETEKGNRNESELFPKLGSGIPVFCDSASYAPYSSSVLQVGPVISCYLFFSKDWNFWCATNQWLSMIIIPPSPVSSNAISDHALSSTAGILVSGDQSIFLVRQRLATCLRQLPGRSWFSSPALR